MVDSRKPFSTIKRMGNEMPVYMIIYVTSMGGFDEGRIRKGKLRSCHPPKAAALIIPGYMGPDLLTDAAASSGGAPAAVISSSASLIEA